MNYNYVVTLEKTFFLAKLKCNLKVYSNMDISCITNASFYQEKNLKKKIIEKGKVNEEWLIMKKSFMVDVVFLHQELQRKIHISCSIFRKKLKVQHISFLIQLEDINGIKGMILFKNWLAHRDQSHNCRKVSCDHYRGL